MGKTNRDFEIEAIDTRIADIEREKEEIREYAKASKSLKEMMETEQYKATIQKIFIDDETKRITDRLTSSEYVQDKEVEQLNKGLYVIRAFNAFVDGMLDVEATAKERLANCDAVIAQENRYRAEVLDGKIDLGDN